MKPGETSPGIQPLLGGVLLRCDGARKWGWSIMVARDAD